MLIFLEKALGEKKIVKHPGSKGGKGYFDTAGKWHYGKKPVGKVEGIPVAPVSTVPAIGSQWHNVKYNANFTVDGIGPDIVHVVGEDGVPHTLSQQNWDKWIGKTIVPAAPVPAPVIAPTSQVAPDADAPKASKKPKKVVPEGAKTITVGAVYNNHNTFYHITSIDDSEVNYDVNTENDFAHPSSEGHYYLPGFQAMLANKEIKYVNTIPVKPSTPAKFDDDPKAGDVYYEKENDQYWHIKEVNPADGKKAISYYISDNFGEEDSYPNWDTDKYWNEALPFLTKVTEAQPLVNDFAKIQEGDIYHNKPQDRYYFITSVSHDGYPSVEYTFANKLEDVQASGEASSMARDTWRENRTNLEFVKHIELPPVEDHHYKAGDKLVVDEGYGKQDVIVFYATKDHIYTTTGNQGESEGFQKYSREAINKGISRGKYQYMPEKKDTEEALVVPPPIDTTPQYFKLPVVDQRFDGLYSNNKMRDIDWSVREVNDKEVVVGPTFASKKTKKNTIHIPLDEWKTGADLYFTYAARETMTAYHPPAFSLSVSEDDDENAKKRVCAGLFNRLATDPEFFAFAQRSFPNMNDFDPRHDAGLPDEVEPAEPESVRQQARVYLLVRSLVHLWAITSADTASMAQCMQRAVADEFGIKGAWDATKSADDSRIDDDPTVNHKAFKALVKQRYDRDGASYRKFVRAQYDETQKFFADKGMKEITLYRGVLNARHYVKFPGGVEDIDTHVILQPQSSFTTHPGNAKTFADSSESGVVYKATLPVTRCISTALTGVGCLGEHEITIMGGPPEVMHAFKATTYNGYDVPMGEAPVDFWKSHTYPLDAIRREVDWLRHGAPRPHPLDEDIRDADWPKRTANIPRSHLSSTLRTLRISHSHLMKLPSGQGFTRKKWFSSIRKSGKTSTLLLT